MGAAGTDPRVSAGASPRPLLLELFQAAVRAVAPAAAMPDPVPPAQGRRVVIAAGKAAAEMMRVLEARGAAPPAGLVVTRYGHLPPGFVAPAGVELIEAGHPYPDANSAR